jgi:hypothetical protein
VRQFLTSGEICDLLAIPQDTLHSWVRQGIVWPAIPPSGKGNRCMFSLVQVWAIAIGRGMRAEGFEVTPCTRVINTLLHMTQGQVEEAFAETPPRDCLMVCGPHVMPMLVEEGAIRENPELLALAEECERQGLLLRPIALKVRGAWDKIISEVEKLDKEAAERRPKSRQAARTGRRREKTAK